MLAEACTLRTYDLSSVSHAELTISMDFIALDSWDNEKAFINLDGTEVWSWYGGELWTLNRQQLDSLQLHDEEVVSVCGREGNRTGNSMSVLLSHTQLLCSGTSIDRAG